MRLIRLVLVSGATLFALVMNVSISSSADDAAKHIGKGAETLPLFDAHVHYKVSVIKTFGTSEPIS